MNFFDHRESFNKKETQDTVIDALESIGKHVGAVHKSVYAVACQAALKNIGVDTRVFAQNRIPEDKRDAAVKIFIENLSSELSEGLSKTADGLRSLAGTPSKDQKRSKVDKKLPTSKDSRSFKMIASSLEKDDVFGTDSSLKFSTLLDRVEESIAEARKRVSRWFVEKNIADEPTRNALVDAYAAAQTPALETDEVLKSIAKELRDVYGATNTDAAIDGVATPTSTLGQVIAHANAATTGSGDTLMSEIKTAARAFVLHAPGKKSAFDKRLIKSITKTLGSEAAHDTHAHVESSGPVQAHFVGKQGSTPASPSFDLGKALKKMPTDVSAFEGEALAPQIRDFFRQGLAEYFDTGSVMSAIELAIQQHDSIAPERKPVLLRVCKGIITRGEVPNPSGLHANELKQIGEVRIAAQEALQDAEERAIDVFMNRNGFDRTHTETRKVLLRSVRELDARKYNPAGSPRATLTTVQHSLTRNGFNATTQPGWFMQTVIGASPIMVGGRVNNRRQARLEDVARLVLDFIEGDALGTNDTHDRIIQKDINKQLTAIKPQETMGRSVEVSGQSKFALSGWSADGAVI